MFCSAIFMTATHSNLTLLSWNINGLRSLIRKGRDAWLRDCGADIVCLQETRILPAEVPIERLPGSHHHFHSAHKRGYAGTATLSEWQPLHVHGLSEAEPEPGEGRVETLEFQDFYLVNVYVPNAQDGLRRLEYRTQVFDPALRAHLKSLDAHKPVVVCGDFNVAHREIDLARPQANRRNAGFTDEERASFDALLDAGFVDIFRHLHPDEPEHYTWWSYRGGARSRNVGWRIDYFLISGRLVDSVQDAYILPEVSGSDHCPVGLKLSFHNKGTAR